MKNFSKLTICLLLTVFLISGCNGNISSTETSSIKSAENVTEAVTQATTQNSTEIIAQSTQNSTENITQSTTKSTTQAATETTAQQTTREPVEPIDRVGIEKLTDRALTAIDLAGDTGAEITVSATDTDGKNITEGVYLSWRYFQEDTTNTKFTLYKNNKVIAENLTLTNYIDNTGKYGDIYKVVGNNDSELGLKQIETAVWQNFYQEFELNAPAPQQLPSETVEFSANDMSLADLDGDGQYELVVKWFPDNGKDNSQAGITGYTYLDGYDIDFSTGKATQLWRIDLGPNIRSGAHYTQFMVWDMDNDGKAEIACKTADGSTTYKSINDELIEIGYIGACNSSAINPAIIGENPNDYRIASGKSLGYILSGPEYLTIFKGDTGEIIDTVDYYPERGNVSAWGDSYGNRVDRFLACVAYLDGKNPSMVFCRGYYTRSTMAAYRLIDNKLTQIWHFDSNEQENNNGSAQGNHNISVADVDFDEKDEIIYGSMVIDDDGTILYNTHLGHGDAMHVGDFLPSREGLEVFTVHETKFVKYQFALRDAETGEILFGLTPKVDVGRGLTGDIDPRYEGEELWSTADKNVYSSLSTFDNPVIVANNKRPSINFSLYWDGDLLREQQDYAKRTSAEGVKHQRTTVTKWNYETKSETTLLETSQFLANVGTNEKMGIVADVTGDWREEIISRHATDRNKIRIYMSTIPTDYNIPCLMQDEVYRLGIAWENVVYNQPVHLSYALTDGLKTSIITPENIIETIDDGSEILQYTINSSEVKLNFSQASDGKYGHKVEGYEIYRTTGSGYKKIATLDSDTLNYIDTDTSNNSSFTYKIAAIVDGKTSYYSLPVKVTIKK